MNTRVLICFVLLGASGLLGVWQDCRQNAAIDDCGSSPTASSSSSRNSPTGRAGGRTRWVS